jgi:hypothetical protein
MKNRRLNGHQCLLAIALTAGLALPLTGAAQIYKWVDEDGVTHFSERPPKNTPAALIKPKTGHSEPVFYGDASSASSEADPEVPDGMVTESDYHQERCEVARQNLETLKNFGRVKVRRDDGEIHYLSEEEQQERVATNQQMADESCQR